MILGSFGVSAEVLLHFFLCLAQKCSKLQFLEIIYGPSLHKEATEKLCLGEGLQSLTQLVLNFTPASHVALQLLIGESGVHALASMFL